MINRMEILLRFAGVKDDLKNLIETYPELSNELKILGNKYIIWLSLRFGKNAKIKEIHQIKDCIQTLLLFSKKDSGIGRKYLENPEFKKRIDSEFVEKSWTNPSDIISMSIDDMEKIMYIYNGDNNPNIEKVKNVTKLPLSDKIGEVGDWEIWLPSSRENSCLIARMDPQTLEPKTTWCTARTKGSNLFYHYIGNDKIKISLYYVIKKNPVDDNDWLSIGCVNGSPKLSGQNGGLSVNRANIGLTYSSLKYILGSDYDTILNIIVKDNTLRGESPAYRSLSRASASKDVDKIIEITKNNSKHEELDLLKNIAKNFYLSKEVFEYLLNFDVLTELSENKNLDNYMLNALYEKNKNDNNLSHWQNVIYANIANNKKTDKNTLFKILEQINKTINENNENINNFRLIINAISNNNKLFHDDIQNMYFMFPKFREHIVKDNKRLNKAVLYDILKENDRKVLFAAAANSNIDGKILEKIYSKNILVLDAAFASNVNTPEHILREIYTRRGKVDYTVACELSKNKNTPRDVLYQISLNSEYIIYFNLASNSSSTSEILDNIAKKHGEEAKNDHHMIDNSFLIKIIEHKNTSKSTLEYIRNLTGIIDLTKKLADKKLMKSASFKGFFKIAASSDDAFHDDGSGRVFWGKQAAGVLLVCQEDQTIFLLKRSQQVEEPGTWGTAGGAIGQEESPQSGANREAKEELGTLPKYKELLHSFVYTSGTFKYTTFVYDISLEEKQQWTPSISLNWENDEYRWFPFDSLPSDLHFGLEFLKKKLEESGLEQISESQGSFDWLIKDIKELHKKYQLPIDEAKKYLALIPANFESYDAHKIQEKNDVLKLAFMPIIKFFISQKNILGFRKSLEIKNRLEQFKKGHPDDLNKPKHEQSQFNQFLYHGLPASDAYSVLQSKQFIKNSAFDRVSLTSDLLIATKFGDVALVFDGKKLQRKYKTKKMRYLTEKQQKYLDIREHNEDSKNPKINQLYSYEKEWSIPLPFKFDDEDLVKLIVFFYDEKTREISKRIKKMLETVTSKPIQLVSVPSYSRILTPMSSRESIESLQLADLRTNIAQNVSGPLNEFIKEGGKLLNKIKKHYSQQYKMDEEQTLYLLRRNEIYSAINYVYREMQQYESFLRQSNYYNHQLKDFERILEAVKSAYATLQNDFSFREDSLKLSTHLKKVIDASESITNNFVNKFLSKDEQIKEMIYSKSYGFPSSYHKQMENWINNHVDYLINTIREENLINDKYKDDDKYSRLINLLEVIKNPSIIPNDIWIGFPIQLIDSKYIENMPDQKLINIFKQVKQIHDKSVDAWIEDHRLDYATGAKKEKYQTIIDALRKNQ